MVFGLSIGGADLSQSRPARLRHMQPGLGGAGAAESPPALYYLRTFHLVATERSFTRAGRRLHLSQPTVSAHIRALERHYGARLFETANRRVRLTDEGAALLPYAER